MSSKTHLTYVRTHMPAHTQTHTYTPIRTHIQVHTYTRVSAPTTKTHVACNAGANNLCIHFRLAPSCIIFNIVQVHTGKQTIHEVFLATIAYIRKCIRKLKQTMDLRMCDQTKLVGTNTSLRPTHSNMFASSIQAPAALHQNCRQTLPSTSPEPLQELLPAAQTGPTHPHMPTRPHILTSFVIEHPEI